MKERLYEILLSDDIEKSINDNLDYLIQLIPELKSIIGFNQNHPHHHLDLFEHTMLVLKNTECDFELRMSALLHDIGKPFCYVIGEDKVNHYPNHGEKSFEISSRILKRLGIENERILYLIRYHDEEIDLSKINDKSLEIKRLKLQYADSLAHHPSTVNKRINKLNLIKDKLFII